MTATRPIDGWPGYYVSDNGEVFSGERALKPRLVNGYCLVTLCREGEHWSVSIHRLMAAAFIRPLRVGEVINHLNGVRTDNRLTNIEITTQGWNAKHAYLLGLRKIDAAHRERAAAMGRAKRKLPDDAIRLIRSNYTGKRGEIARLAEAFQTHHKTVRAILNGSAYGDVK